MHTLSEQGCTGAASAAILAAVQGTRVLCLLFSPELFILSICVSLSLRNVTTEAGKDAPFSFSLRQRMHPAASRCPLPSLTPPAICLSPGAHPFSFGAE